MREKFQLRLALGIISGRIKIENLDYLELDLLGYDNYRFSYLDKPEESDLLEKCEDIVFNAIMSSLDNEDKK